MHNMQRTFLILLACALTGTAIGQDASYPSAGSYPSLVVDPYSGSYGWSSGMSFGSEICTDVYAYIGYAYDCAFPVKQQLFFYLVYGADFFDNWQQYYAGGEDNFWDEWEWSSSWINSGSWSYPSGSYSYPSGSWSYPTGSSSYPSGSWSYPSGSWSYQGFSLDLSGSWWYNWDGWTMDICGEAMDHFSHCMQPLTMCLEQETVDDLVSSYRNGYCDGNDLKEEYAAYDGAINEEALLNLEHGFSCIHMDDLMELFMNDTCYVNPEVFHIDGSVDEGDVVANLRGTTRAIFACIREHLQENNGCEDLAELEPLLFYLYVQIAIPGISPPFPSIFAGFDTSAVDPHEERRSTVAVYGDPHLFIYGSHAGASRTCVALGNQKYLYNSYVEFWGVSDYASEGEDGTFLTSIEISFKSGQSVHAVYNASDSQLPSTFSYSRGSSVEIEVVDNGEYVQLSSANQGAVFSIRRVENTYMVVARLSDSVFDSSSGLLVSGCTDPIDRQAAIGARRRKRQIDVCSSQPAEFEETCAYDYSVTGNANLATAAGENVDTMISDAEEYDAQMIAYTNDNNDDDNGANGHLYMHLPLLVMSLVAGAMANKLL